MRSTPWYWMQLKLREQALDARYTELVGALGTLGVREEMRRLALEYNEAVADVEEWELLYLDDEGGEGNLVSQDNTEDVA